MGFKMFLKVLVYKKKSVLCGLFLFDRLQFSNLRVNLSFFSFTDVSMSSNFLSHCNEATRVFKKTNSLLWSNHLVTIKPNVWSAR